MISKLLLGISRDVTRPLQPESASAFTSAPRFCSTIQRQGPVLDEFREAGWRKLIFRRWNIVYTIHGDSIIIGRVRPDEMGEADFQTPL